MANSTAFSAETRRYLETLPAVARVTDSRIYYTTEFRTHAMERYAGGDSPSRIFADAGMSPKLIGYKRIERAFARWREASDVMPARREERRQNAVADDGRVDDVGSQADLCIELIGRQSLEIAELKRQIEVLRERLADNGKPGESPDSEPQVAVKTSGD